MKRASADSNDTAIAELATRVGLLIEWEDASGKTQRVSDATLARLLKPLGLPCDTPALLAQSLATLDAESPACRLPPLLTATVGQDLLLTAGVVQAGDRYTVALEGGRTIEGVVQRHTHAGKEDGALSINAIDVAGYHTLRIHSPRVAETAVQLAVAPTRCFGVSDALARLHDVDASASASGAVPLGAPHLKPHVAENKKLWGITAQVYGLGREGDGMDAGGGVGDFTALAMLARDSARQGASAVAISPMHAMFSADPGKFSPYSPSSRLFLNVLHIDPASFFGHAAVAAAVDALAAASVTSGATAGPSASAASAASTPGTQSAAAAAPVTPAASEEATLIDWPRVATGKLGVLRYLFDRWQANEQRHDEQRNDEPRQDERHAAFAAFCEAGGAALENHARFEALHAAQIAAAATDDDAAEATGSPYNWRHWPEALRDPRSPAVASFADAHRDDVDFHLFLQWLANQGLADAQRAAREAGMPIGLIADLAVGCDGAGSQTWSDPESMLNGLSVGAPPDLFNQAGQAWGLTTFSPRALVNQGFRAFIDMVRGAFAHAGGIRVDHILGLRRLWLVPEGESAKHGAYLRYPLDDLLRLLALESWRHHAIVIGEDLGTVPPGLRERLAESGLLGMRVLWFERVPASNTVSGKASSNAASARDGFVLPKKWTEDAIAMTTTHDLPTIVGWWEGQDIAWRAKIGQSGDDVAAHRQEHADRLADRTMLWRALIDAGIVAAGTAEPTEAPVDAVLQFVAASHAPLALFPMEDLLGLADQPNLPGSIDEHPNWRRRLPLMLGQSSQDATQAALAASLTARQRLINTTRHAVRVAHPASPTPSSIASSARPTST